MNILVVFFRSGLGLGRSGRTGLEGLGVKGSLGWDCWEGGIWIGGLLLSGLY